MGWTIGSLTLNDGLENIGNAVFTNVKGTINIPNSVKSIKSIAFEGSFNKVIIGTGLTSLAKNAFASTANVYWKKFASIIEDASLVSGNGEADDSNGDSGNGDNQINVDYKNLTYKIDGKEYRMIRIEGNGLLVEAINATDICIVEAVI